MQELCDWLLGDPDHTIQLWIYFFCRWSYFTRPLGYVALVGMIWMMFDLATQMCRTQTCSQYYSKGGTIEGVPGLL